jgi:glyceraldehyde-3-phosphate dehydrogenase (NADP+)
MNIHAFYTGGVFKSSPKTKPVYNPYTQKAISKVCLAELKDLQESICNAQRAKIKYKTLSMRERARILMQISKAIIKQSRVLSKTLVLETAKPHYWAEREVYRCSETFALAARFCKHYQPDSPPANWSSRSKGIQAVIEHEGIGIVFGISPFNFPLNLPAHKIAPAIAAGCPIILKPAPQTPLSALLLAKIIDKTPLPKGGLSVLPMTHRLAKTLVQDDRISLLSFTGSATVGWQLKTQSGKKKCILELGGNAAAVISASASIKNCMQEIIDSGFGYSGQVCNHAQRFYIHPKHFNRFIHEVKLALKELSCGDPLLPNTRFSCMISEKEARRVETWIKEAVQQGAKLVFGGKRKNNFMPPTLLTHTHSKMKIHSEEVFGPVICVNPYNGSIEHAVNLVNESRYGIQASIYTRNKNELKYAFKHIETAAVLHNLPTTFRLEHMPYGGIKESGLGREGIVDAFYSYCEPKLLLSNG